MSVLRVAIWAAARRPAPLRPLASRGIEQYMADPLEHATGLEKRELLALKGGNTDPFNTQMLTRGPGTKDKPNVVYSAFDSRIVGCICNDDCAAVNWMWVHKGTPRRCGCGHWFELVAKAPI